MRSERTRRCGGSTVVVIAALFVLTMLCQTVIRSRSIVRHVAKSSLHQYQTECFLAAAKRKADVDLSPPSDGKDDPISFRWEFVPSPGSGLAMRTAMAWSETDDSGGVTIRVRCDFGRYAIERHVRVTDSSNKSSASERPSDE